VILDISRALKYPETHVKCWFSIHVLCRRLQHLRSSASAGNKKVSALQAIKALNLSKILLRLPYRSELCHHHPSSGAEPQAASLSCTVADRLDVDFGANAILCLLGGIEPHVLRMPLLRQWTHPSIAGGQRVDERQCCHAPDAPARPSERHRLSSRLPRADPFTCRRPAGRHWRQCSPAPAAHVRLLFGRKTDGQALDHLLATSVSTTAPMLSCACCASATAFWTSCLFSAPSSCSMDPMASLTICRRTAVVVRSGL